MLGVTEHASADDADDPIAPKNLRRRLDFQHFVFGDFEVCPFTEEKPGEMQMVCVQNASHLKLQPYGYGKRH